MTYQSVIMASNTRHWATYGNVYFHAILNDIYCVKTSKTPPE